MTSDLLSPRLTELLGVETPIVQSGMGGVAGPDLAAAVSNAGALGVVAALNLSPEQVRSAIEDMRSRTDRPFGVNIWLHECSPMVSPGSGRESSRASSPSDGTTRAPKHYRA